MAAQSAFEPRTDGTGMSFVIGLACKNNMRTTVHA